MSTKHTYFAACARGLESLLHAEASALQLPNIERQVGGIRFEGKPRDMMRANLWLRTAGRVLRRVERFEAQGSDALYRGVTEIAWEQWMRKGGTLRVDCQTKDSALDHSRFVEQRVKDGVVDRFAKLGLPRPEVVGEEADLRIHAHLYRDRVTLALDSSGPALRKRGWRVAQGRAPLSETLAAAMVLHSGWKGKAPLIDPFCGSGTLLVEGALFATNTAPGLFRDGFGFERWRDFDAKLWKRVKADAEAARKPLGKTRLVGFDHNPERITETRANLIAAGFEDKADLQAISALDWPGKPGWNAQVLTNPPYGVRVGNNAKVDELYHALAKHWAKVAQGYAWTLLTEKALAADFDLPAFKSIDVTNGAIDCALLKGRVPQ